MADQKENNLVEIFALWKNTSKSGETYLTGKMGNGRVLVLKNNYKEADNQPDYRVYITKNDQENGNGNGGGGKGGRGNEEI
jgi:uncharacterized protein (DUF736 family)